MRNTNSETGEYELVVGNKQLLSGFFIVVVLCAVAFAMGYVVGQNSPRGAKLGGEPAAAAANAADGRPQPASPAPVPVASNPPASQPEASSPPPADSASTPPADSAPPQPTTQPARDASPPAAAPPAAAEPAQPPAGAFWQVFATKNQESARDLLQTLKDKGFPVQLSPGPDNLTRVLVGPYTDTASMGKAKTALENAGFRPVRK